MAHNPRIPHKRPDSEKFLLAAFALALVGTIEADEPVKSARWNRARQAHDPLIRLCDTYLPDGLQNSQLSKIWDIIDGPVMKAIRRHVGVFNEVLNVEDLEVPTVARDHKTGRFISCHQK